MTLAHLQREREWSTKKKSLLISFSNFHAILWIILCCGLTFQSKLLSKFIRITFIHWREWKKNLPQQKAHKCIGYPPEISTKCKLCYLFFFKTVVMKYALYFTCFIQQQNSNSVMLITYSLFFLYPRSGNTLTSLISCSHSPSGETEQCSQKKKN